MSGASEASGYRIVSANIAYMIPMDKRDRPYVAILAGGTVVMINKTSVKKRNMNKNDIINNVKILARTRINSYKNNKRKITYYTSHLSQAGFSTVISTDRKFSVHTVAYADTLEESKLIALKNQMEDVNWPIIKYIISPRLDVYEA